MQTPDYYRHRAKEVRHLGETLGNPELRAQMNMLAKEYEYLAVTAEHMRRSFRDAPKGSADRKPVSARAARMRAR